MIFAAGLVVTVVALEYAARHLLAPALPVLATPRVDDMVVTGVVYAALSVLTARVVGAGPASLGALRGALRSWHAWVGGLVALATLPVALIDTALWGSVRLPSYSFPQSSTVLFAGATWLEPASLLLVNALVVPVAEEWLWRGVIQPRFVARLRAVAGVGVTACLFSVKHAVVDASLGRLLFVFAGGVALGWVALRASWRASALSHVLLNSVATVLSLAAAAVGADAACAKPPPPRSPEVSAASDRVMALFDRQDETEIEALFTPTFLEKVGRPETLRVLGSVHDHQGSCRFQCMVSSGGPYDGVELLQCDRGTEWMSLRVEKAEPHRITRLVVHPWFPGAHYEP